jgi:hypothetical protein
LSSRKGFLVLGGRATDLVLGGDLTVADLSWVHGKSGGEAATRAQRSIRREAAAENAFYLPTHGNPDQDGSQLRR